MVQHMLASRSQVFQNNLRIKTLLSLTPLQNIPLIRQNDNLADILLKSLQETNIELHDDDILVLAQKIVSKSEGRMVNLATVTPSDRALDLAEKSGFSKRWIIESLLSAVADLGLELAEAEGVEGACFYLETSDGYGVKITVQKAHKDKTKLNS